jgi:hypothetical protein
MIGHKFLYNTGWGLTELQSLHVQLEDWILVSWNSQTFVYMQIACLVKCISWFKISVVRFKAPQWNLCSEWATLWIAKHGGFRTTALSGYFFLAWITFYVISESWRIGFKNWWSCEFKLSRYANSKKPKDHRNLAIKSPKCGAMLV